jgi:N-acetylglucosamine-6-sulfatase
MSGMWPHNNGCTRNSVVLPPQFRVLTELIAESDYRTAYFGKWHLGDETVAQRGFENWLSVRNRPGTDYHAFLKSKGIPPDKPNGGYTTVKVSSLPLELSKPKFLERLAWDFIERYKHDPFILVVGFVEPHSPYNGPFNDEHPLSEIDVDPTAAQADDSSIPLRYRLMREWQQSEAALDRTRLPAQFFFGETREEYRSIKQRYLGLITLIDQSIGGILACAERAGIADQTIVVHTSDHGDMLSAHRLFGKEVMFEQAVRVPWLVRLPGQRQQRMISQRVSQIDFLPTLLDLLGKTKPDQCAGKSLLPLMRGEAIAPESVVIEWAPNRTKIKKGTSLAPRREIKRAIEESTRTVISPDGWKLCLRDKDLNELYNLNEDPLETRNLYEDRQYAPVISRLAGEIHRWQETTHDALKL